MPEIEMNDGEIIELWARFGNGIIEKLLASPNRDDIVAASHTLMRRLVNSGSTLRILYDHAKEHDWNADGASILRTSYDAMFQALYILVDPTQRQQRARRFIDFAIVEQVKMIRLFDKQLTQASKKVAGSPKRAAVEASIQQEYKRVCDLYGYDMQKPRTNWYAEGSLRDLAIKTGYESEYEIVHKQLSAVVHSSMFGITGESAFKGFNAMQCYWLFSFRVLRKLADYLEITLSDSENRMLEMANQNVLDAHDFTKNPDPA